jgi:1,4-alpha-glucan branching enzyme/glycosyltransferase involved in cell wall biosynthesis
MEEQERAAAEQANLEKSASKSAFDDIEGELQRWPSMHLFGGDNSGDEADSKDAKVPVDQATLANFQEMVKSVGDTLLSASSKSDGRVFGLHQEGDLWTYCEWLPGMKSAALVGDFNAWHTEGPGATPLVKDKSLEDVWSCEIKGEQARAMKKGQKYKVFAVKNDGHSVYMMPTMTTRMTFSPEVNMLDSIVWPVTPKVSSVAMPSPKGGDRIYECHLGLAAGPGQPKCFEEAAKVIIPRAVRNGYTSVLLIGVQECKRYSNMGLQPVGYFAPAHCLGHPEEFQAFVEKAHAAGLRVYMTVGHDGAAGCADGLPDHFFKSGAAGMDPCSGARAFDYSKPEVLRFLLSNFVYWIRSYGIDGFRLPRVASMIYTHRGRWLPEDVSELAEYVQKPGMLNEPGIQFLRLANWVVHEQGKLSGKSSITIAEESSLFPGLCKPIKDEGLGFDFRQSAHASTVFRKLLKVRDEDWSMEGLLNDLSRPRVARKGEPVIACAESSQDCVVSRRPLKIAFLAWETLHTIAVGGVAPHVTELGAALNSAGHEVHIFTRAQGNNNDNCILGVHYHEVNYGKHSCLVTDVNNMCGAFVGALHGHEHVWGAFDIVHGHDWLAGPAICQLRGEGKRCVFTMHSTEGGRNGDMSKGHPGVKDIERGGCGATEKLICVSGVLRDEVFSACGADGGRTSVIYNGIHADKIVNTPWCDEWTGNVKKDKGWNPMDPMFLFVGRHTQQKGCDILIEAIPGVLASRGDAKFVIVGDGHLFAANKGKADALGVSHAICFTGSLKSGSDHLKALFRACDAVVVPSRNEPFGIVVLEAWCSGKPVVATTSGGPRDFVKPGEDGFLVDPNPGSVAWGCCKIMENFEHSKWMGLNAQAKALREFSWETIAMQTEEVYYSLLNLTEAPKSLDPNAGQPLANMLLKERCMQMGVAERDELVLRGIAILKLSKLLTVSFAGDAVMTWMGNEFGQIDPIDMPRPANGFGDEQARIKYELADDSNLRFSQLQAFEAHLNKTEGACGWLAAGKTALLAKDEEAKVIAVARGGCVFVFNFHPSQEHRGYSIVVPSDAAEVTTLKLALDTDEQRFGGSGAASRKDAFVAKRGALTVNLPPRSALVLGPVDEATIRLTR